MNCESQYVLSKLRNELQGEDINKNMDWKLVLNLLNKHKLLPFLYDEIIGDVPVEYSQLYMSKLEENIDKQQKLWKLFIGILEMAEKEKLKIVLPKGFPIAYELYGDINLRVSGDIDLLVKKEDIEKLCEIMSKIGAFHRHNGKIKDIIKKFTSDEFDNFYELKFIKQQPADLLWLEVKKATDAIPEKHIVEFIDSAIKTPIDGYGIWRLDDAHMFVHLCANAHKDTEEHEGICANVFRARNFVDIWRFISQKGKNVNWNDVKEIAERCDVLHKVIWALKSLEELIPKVKNEKGFIEAKQVCCGNEFELKNDRKMKHIEWKTGFVERLFNNELARKEYGELISKRRWSENNPYYRKPLEVNSDKSWYAVQNGKEDRSLYYNFSFQDGKIYISLKTDDNKDVIEALGGDRLYFSFIANEKNNEDSIDAIGSPSIGIVFFVTKGTLMVKVGNKSIWTVNDRYLSNDQIEGGTKVRVGKDTREYEVEANVDVAGILKNKDQMAYNVWLDGAVLDDYYCHKWYKFSLDQDFGIISVEQ